MLGCIFLDQHEGRGSNDNMESACWRKWQRFQGIYCGGSEERSDVDLDIMAQEGILQSDK